jgi:hypothetical protein
MTKARDRAIKGSPQLEKTWKIFPCTIVTRRVRRNSQAMTYLRRRRDRVVSGDVEPRFDARAAALMKRPPPERGPVSAPQTVLPNAAHAKLALREAETVMEPIAAWLIRNGVPYPAFAELLKKVFVKAAAQELTRDAAKPTQSALSLLSGVHRKDVRLLEGLDVLPRTVPRPPLSSQVFTRWVSDPRYRGRDGKPRALKRSGPGRTFEMLCREVSSDVHPRAILDELLRLGQVGIDEERIVVLSESFVPTTRLDELTALFSANVSDHIAAAVSNLTTEAAKYLEQSIYADGLTPTSADVLQDEARALWARTFETFVNRARKLVEADANSAGEHRVRLGVYFFSEPSTAATDRPKSSRAKGTAARGKTEKRQR